MQYTNINDPRMQRTTTENAKAFFELVAAAAAAKGAERAQAILLGST